VSVLAPLHGLVLAGGASRRMGRDKATLDYHGRPQLEWTWSLLARHCERTFVSVRAGQDAAGPRAALPCIVDRVEGAGPIAGIEAAFAAHPAAAWLVVACDLPFITDATLAHLVARRGDQCILAYRSAHDGLPEPLCAIYEPGAREAVLAALAEGRHCPRRLIVRSGVALLELPDAAALDNVNTPDDLADASRRLGRPGPGTYP
jgi:molybdenum cofactor guanylyltransferase